MPPPPPPARAEQGRRRAWAILARVRVRVDKRVHVNRCLPATMVRFESVRARASVAPTRPCGRLQIHEGEELCWDYASVTESEREFRAAICLCGSSKCRGSFLYYANSATFTEVMSRQHTFLDRTALLLRAGATAREIAFWRTDGGRVK